MNNDPYNKMFFIDEECFYSLVKNGYAGYREFSLSETYERELDAKKVMLEKYQNSIVKMTEYINIILDIKSELLQNFSDEWFKQENSNDV